MITQSYTDERESLISPGNFCGEKRHICDIAVATFSNEILEAVLERYPHQEVAQIGSANGRKPVYRVSIQDREIMTKLPITDLRHLIFLSMPTPIKIQS